MEERLASGTGDARKIKANASALAETLPTASRAGRHRRARGPVDQPSRASRRHGRRGSLPARRASGRPDRAQGGAGRRSRGSGRQLDAMEGRRRPAARNPRRVEDDHRARPQSRRRAVEALFGRQGNLQPAAGIALRRAGPRAIGGARSRRNGSASAPRSCPRSTDWSATSAEFRKLLTEWKAVGRATKERRRRAVAALQGRPGRVLHRPQRRDGGEGRGVRAPMPPPRRRCWPKRKSSTPATTTPPGRRCGRSPTNGTRSARCRESGPPSWSGGCARSRRGCATPATRTGPTLRRRPAPSSSAPVPSSSNGRHRRRRRPAGPRKPKRRKPTPNSGGSGPMRRPQALTRRA